MTEAIVGFKPEASEHTATLFVEGASPRSLDPVVLSELLEEAIIAVLPLGASYHVKSAADALHKENPNYFFLIDRDHYDEKAVNKSWKDFLNPDKGNILVWKRRELENYFLIPEYLLLSEYLNKSEKELKRQIVKIASQRIYLDAANIVITSIREELKKNWIELPENAVGFKTKHEALATLLAMPAFTKKKKSVAEQLDGKSLTKKYEETIEMLFGGATSLQFGCGLWLENVRGKHILPTLINNCFKVVDDTGETLQGNEKLKRVVVELLRKPLVKQPEDFQELCAVISKRIELL